MIDSRQTSQPTDEGMVEHFRQHTAGEPPASLDALILATARREAPTPAPSLWQRWLRACQRPRWQMAFASVAGLALVIGLVVRSPVPQGELSSPASMEFSARQQEALVAPAAPIAMPAPAPMTATKPQADTLQGSLSAEQPAVEEPAAKMSKRSAVVQPSLEQGLLQILRLRQAGDSKKADEELLKLHQRFPEEDLPARLEALQKR
ncbi:hypothetical protein [Pseudomonas citri]|uniref:hypothetical protein n=1 Tax=Pseudomonas citri TaxID=2978349 RepID=UPI0021B577F2|nr:hypothetical protein [Pseudomonas citri]